MYRRIHRAFTMVELIFVIVILGIVSSIGSEIIVRVYSSYIVERAQHDASIKTQLAINQIANRLKYAIPGTIVRRKSVGSAPEMVISAGSGTYDVLEWVARDGDSFEAIDADNNRQPGWSGFCDVDGSSKTSISTPGSNLSLADTIIKNLSDSTKSITDARVFFALDSLQDSHLISAANGSTITLTENNTSHITERYYLAWTSYALVWDKHDLYLYYNFDPAYQAAIPTGAGVHRSLLLKNVTTFKFTGEGQTTRVKLCIDQNISATATIPSCKEKAIF